MTDPDPFDFTPVPVRARRDGWTPDRQRRFIHFLAAGCGPTEAARAVGMTRQTAFALRGRPGAESFAAAWDSAVAFARQRRFDSSPRSASAQAFEGVLVPRFYRGRLVSVERRFPSAPLIRVLAQLDRWAEKPRSAGGGDLSFDELLDMLAPRAAPLRRRRRPSSREELDDLFRARREGYGN
ncbi:hypothetical protein [Allosphingosinicella sp.]|jgi:hypothetical protein|uniref:hypothetical protein n=1 Tax=Allosphingosinicella sp. TaxID=2823234 RepID=UPI002EE49986